ncbi:3-hydroxyacyl-CoA dehydrogenase NAD-binding domain-containing protein [Nocardia sp. CA-120079]|uniref:3-hydroxyacyl-CoA dehydrogenase NAD-binding domain-containing protein n=1 Tax=Nocardia sp. CA-120079 TaxID=3239974 RepID=UPI003D990BCF
MDSSGSAVTWDDQDGVVTLTFDHPGKSVNVVDQLYLDSVSAALSRLRSQRNQLAGVIVTSAKKTFLAGADLRMLAAKQPGDAEDVTAFTTQVKAQLRELETLGVPVVAAINGSALGGGYELALACHHRIAVAAPGLRVGLPEATLGLLPGGGGLVRTVRLLGLDRALDDVLLTGRTYDVERALELGLIDATVESVDDLSAAAHEWIRTHPAAVQPWDESAALPGGDVNDPRIAASLPARISTLRARHKGSPAPAPEAILSAAVESIQVDVDTAFAIETRYFVRLVTGQVAKNIIQGTFFDRQAVNSGSGRPTDFPRHEAREIAVLGAGLMGAGIALTAALSGALVRLKDVDQAAGERGREYAQRYLNRQVASGGRTRADADAVLDRISVVTDPTDLTTADLVIEAVFEDPNLKARVIREVADVVSADAILASNTSTLPISALGSAVGQEERLVGMHFFSPVERMDLLEIVVGERTSEQTVARAFDVARQLGKTPIVVNDGRGFFTSRVIIQRLLEAAAMLAEGISPSSIEQASMQAGYPLGTLALNDETSISLPNTIYTQFRDEALRAGAAWVDHPGGAALAAMVAAGRTGRAAGGGYYEYLEGRRAGFWPALAEMFGPFRPAEDIGDLVDRLLFAEALETARCLESGVLRSTADANVGSILGIGYPVWTGGAAQFVAGYPGGQAAFVARATQLARTYGQRFEPPAGLLESPSTSR